MDYEKEYKRWKARAERLDKDLKKRKEDEAGWQELLQANNAIVAAVLRCIGAGKGDPLKVPQQAVREELAGKHRVCVGGTADNYLLYVEEA
jgi:hypothetical protein